jgi:hypothetical protein
MANAKTACRFLVLLLALLSAPLASSATAPPRHGRPYNGMLWPVWRLLRHAVARRRRWRRRQVGAAIDGVHGAWAVPRQAAHLPGALLLVAELHERERRQRRRRRRVQLGLHRTLRRLLLKYFKARTYHDLLYTTSIYFFEPVYYVQCNAILSICFSPFL